MDCLIVDDEEMSRNMVQHFVQQTDSLKLVGVCTSGIEAANVLSKTKVDILFLDVEMPEMSGYELIKSLDDPPLVVLITSKKDHAAEAFEYKVVDYLLKPLTYARFLIAVGKVKEMLEMQQIRLTNRNELYVRSEQRFVKINLADILYIEALADYIMIFTSNNNKYIVHSTMKGFQARLPKENFARVHRSYIVNTDKIEAIENLFILINNKQIPIGASYKDEFMGRLNLL
ncbi:LytR/AlgR family response regulator transcription factor [Sporocytophaga myxococcoides]|nr:LytTR family DNA-binding domain-containing protein [Sporocytophaga myxococcoides]